MLKIDRNNLTKLSTRAGIIKPIPKYHTLFSLMCDAINNNDGLIPFDDDIFSEETIKSSYNKSKTNRKTVNLTKGELI
jgi:hypothetical protein